MKGETEVTEGSEAGKDLNMYKRRYKAPSKGKRRIQYKAWAWHQAGTLWTVSAF